MSAIAQRRAAAAVAITMLLASTWLFPPFLCLTGT